MEKGIDKTEANECLLSRHPGLYTVSLVTGLYQLCEAKGVLACSWVMKLWLRESQVHKGGQELRQAWPQRASL